MELTDYHGPDYSDSEFETDLELLRPYFLTDANAPAVIGPFLVFGILATAFLLIWSAGMMKPCCPCGSCPEDTGCGYCRRPPAFTKGKIGHGLTFITVALGGAAAILAIRGLASSAQQDVALEGVRDSLKDFAQWPNQTVTQLDEVVNTVAMVIPTAMAATTKNLDTTLNSLPPAVKTSVLAATTGLSAQMVTAQTYMNNAKRQMADVENSLRKKSVDMTEIFDGTATSSGVIKNKTVKLVFLLLWIVLVGLMGLQIIIALLRRLAPSKTKGGCCACMFGVLTGLALFVMFWIFIVSTVLYCVLMLLGDLCANPDNIVKGVLGGDICEVRLHTDGVTRLYNDNCAFTLEAGGVGGGSGSGGSVTKVYAIDAAAASAEASVRPDKEPAVAGQYAGNLNRDQSTLGYFMTCDTKVNATNPFNIELERTMDAVLAAQVMLGADFFAAFEASADYDTLKADSAKLTNYNAGKKSVVDAIAPVVLQLSDLSEKLSGNRSAADIDWDANYGQGLTQGLLSQFNCYQGNARWNAMVNMLCNTTFTTFAQTCEYFMAAAVLMIIIQWTKRWSRPYVPDDGDDGKGGGGGGNDVAETKFGGDPVVNSLMAL